MSHSNELRKFALGASLASQPEKAAAARAGADALDTVDRVRKLLTSLRRSQQLARRRWDATCDTWDGAASDTLHYIIYDLTNALEGDTK